MAKAKKVKPRRFYRGNLESIVWDPENQTVLVDFLNSEVKGTVTTDNPRTQDILDGLGYIEVGLDQEYPPEIPDPVQGEMQNVKQMPPNITEDAARTAEINKAKRDAALKKAAEDDQGPAVDPPKTTASTKKKREIKRRKK